MLHSWLIPHQQLFTQQLQQGTLPHALILSGVEGAGKHALAAWLSQVFVCSAISIDEQHIMQPCQRCKNCQLYLGGNYPDHINVIKEKNTLGVDEIRQLTQFLQKTAQMSGKKSVIIHDADAMTESAANALLKTLEEPSQHSHLILLSADVDRLLPTIISRCRIIQLRPHVGKKLGETLSFESDDHYVNLTHLAELQSEQDFILYKRFFSLFCTFLMLKAPRAEIQHVLIEQPHGLRWLEKVFTDLMRHYHGWPTNIPVELQSELKASSLTTEHIFQSYKIFLQSQQHLVNLVQVNKNLVVENMLIAIWQYVNPTHNN